MKQGVLYISYNGMLEPLGQSQVLAYLKLLSVGRRIHLISFEKAEDWNKSVEREQVTQEIAGSPITWHPLRYHKRPTSLATAWDIVCGILLGLWLVTTHKLEIVHARSYVAAVMALAIKKLTRKKFLFDMRGFWADEQIDGGLWPYKGRMYKVAKWFEKRFFLDANHVVSLTNAAVGIIEKFDYLQGSMPPTTVIPTCADLSRFKPSLNLKQDAPFVLGYVGTVGTWYMFDQAVACFVRLLRLKPDARFLIVNRGEHAYINRCLEAFGVPSYAVHLITAAHFEVPQLIAHMDAGVFFIKPVYSKQASAPTKLAEFLGCGIPCIVNTGVGDMAEILESADVGVALNAFDDGSMQAGLKQLLKLTSDNQTRARCIAAAHKHFSLSEGVRRYESIYEQLER